jgi:CheY-like chemotaxis protein
VFSSNFMCAQSEPQERLLGTILLIEDDPSDAALIQGAFQKIGVQNPISLVSHGDTALAYLEGINEYADRIRFPLPILIILDLKLPGMSGLQLLKWIRTKKELRLIPVVVLTGSSDNSQIQAAYEAGANSYLLKPGNRDEIVRIVELLEHYWVERNVAPPLVRRAHENL